MPTNKCNSSVLCYQTDLHLSLYPLLVLRSPAALSGEQDLLLTFGDDGSPKLSPYSPDQCSRQAAGVPSEGELHTCLKAGASIRAM